MELTARKRSEGGKSVKLLRAEGLIPAELYGRGIENAHLIVEESEFRKVFREAGENTVIDLIVDGEKRKVLIHDVQRHYLKGTILHVDFYQIREDEKVTARVPLKFRGESPAVKEKGALLNKAITEVEVRALPGDLPKEIDVDLAALDEVDKSIYIRDLSIPRGVEVTLDPDTVVATAMEREPEQEESKQESEEAAKEQEGTSSGKEEAGS